MIIELHLTPEEAKYAKDEYRWVDERAIKAGQNPNELRFVVFGDTEEVLSLFAKLTKGPASYESLNAAQLALVHRWQGYRFGQENHNQFP